MSAVAAKRPEDGNNYVVRPAYKHKYAWLLIFWDPAMFLPAWFLPETAFSCPFFQERLCLPRFPVPAVKELMKTVLREKLTDKAVYSTETSKEIADEIKARLKGA